MDAKRRPVLVIGGPTAAGKSSLALQLAKIFPLEIVSADARQVFTYLNTGTAKPTQQEQLEVKHHCIDICHPSEDYNAARFLTDARNAVNIVSETHLPVLVGGSGMYISAATDGFSTAGIEPNEELREALRQKLDRNGIEALFSELEVADPIAAEKYSDRNPRRILRALEYIGVTNKKFSETWTAEKNHAEFDPVFIGVRFQEKEKLNLKINERCQQMWNGGLIAETQSVLEMGVDRDAQSLRTVGYREALQFIHDEIDATSALMNMKTTTRQYAKRQRTWFYRDERYTWFEGSDKMIVDAVLTHLKSVPSVASFVDL